MPSEDNVIAVKLITELQALAGMYGEQFNLIRATIEGMKEREEERHNKFMEEMAAQETARSALTTLVDGLDIAVQELQQATVALVNISNQTSGNS